MTPNPYLKKLGFSPTDRVAIVHTDDIGMCQATLPAIADLLDFGLVSSAAVMVPCPWFQGAAQYAREHPGVDFGVHLTLNSEWDIYRWGPLSTRDAASGLLDGHGYFYDRTEPIQEGANLSALQLELDTQLARAKAAGIDPTHADTHMFCLGHPRLFETYLRSALDAGTLPFTVRPDGPGWHKLGLPDDGALFRLTEQLVERGVPTVDDVCWMNLETHENRLEEAKQHFDELQPGFTHFILHPSVDTLEIRAMAPDWRCRVADYETFMSEGLRDYVKESGVQVIGYKALLNAMGPA
jgi:chitin disaccharide deacetylase